MVSTELLRVLGYSSRHSSFAQSSVEEYVPGRKILKAFLLGTDRKAHKCPIHKIK